jgi:uncharacterized protein YneF (UPF0154 family)
MSALIWIIIVLVAGILVGWMFMSKNKKGESIGKVEEMAKPTEMPEDNIQE